MKIVIAVVVVAASLTACSKDRPAEPTGTTTVTRGTADTRQPGSPYEAPKVRDDEQQRKMGPGTDTSMGGERSTSRSQAVRKHLEDKAPRSVTIIRGLIISDDGEVVTISGIVPDEETHQALAKAAREAPNVKGVKDEIKVQKK